MQAAGGDAKEITLLVSNPGEGGQGMASPCRGGTLLINLQHCPGTHSGVSEGLTLPLAASGWG